MSVLPSTGAGPARIDRLGPRQTGAGLVGAATAFERGATAAYANFWWGMTPSAVRAMLDLARFRIVEECQPHPLTFELVAEAVRGDEILPQLDFSRQRGLDREQGPPDLTARLAPGQARQLPTLADRFQ